MQYFLFPKKKNYIRECWARLYYGTHHKWISENENGSHGIWGFHNLIISPKCSRILHLLGGKCNTVTHILYLYSEHTESAKTLSRDRITLVKFSGWLLFGYSSNIIQLTDWRIEKCLENGLKLSKRSRNNRKLIETQSNNCRITEKRQSNNTRFMSQIRLRHFFPHGNRARGENCVKTTITIITATPSPPLSSTNSVTKVFLFA